MSRIYVVETDTKTVGLAVPAENGMRFYAADHAFAALEKRLYARLDEIRAAVNRLAASPATIEIVRVSSGRRVHKRTSTR